MAYLDAIKGGFISLVIFIILIIFIPGKGLSEDVQLLLTVSTFLFAILGGFFISRAVTRYNEIRRMLGSEDALILSLYKASRIKGNKIISKMKSLIEKYIMISYDVETKNYWYRETTNIFMKMWDILLKKKSQMSDEIFVELLSDLENQRNRSAALSEEEITAGQWIILIILSAIILFSLFYLRTPELYSSIITVILSTSIIIVLLLLRDIQNLMVGGKPILEESGQEVLETMGCMRYYNNNFFDKKTIPKNVKKYRLGLHKFGEKPNIKIVKVE